MKGYYGVEDVCLSLPSIVNDKGIERVLELPLSDKEIELFRHSANTLKESLREIGF
jgi:L-lactate dehydrogenase